MQRRGRVLGLAVAGLFGMAQFAAAAPFSTATSAVFSNLTLNLYLRNVGDPPPSNAGTDQDQGYIGTVGAGPLTVSGTADADLLQDGLQNGTLQFNGSNLGLQDGFSVFDVIIADPPNPPTQLGTVDATNTGIAFNLANIASQFPVAAGNFSMDTGLVPFALTIDQGTIVLDNPTGLLAFFLTEPLVVDFSTDPVAITDQDVLGTGIGGIAVTGTEQDIVISFPDVVFFVFDLQPTITAEIYGILSGDIGLNGGAVIPEPNSMMLLGAGGLLFGGVGYMRRKKAKTAKKTEEAAA